MKFELLITSKKYVYTLSRSQANIALRTWPH